jgi:hypothetical protein
MQARQVRVPTASGEDLTRIDDPAKIMMRQIAAEIARLGHRNGKGRPFAPMQVARLLEA